MSISYNDKLNDGLTKEIGGRQGGKGHEFQRYWALCHLLDRDLEGKDYLILMEFIEDIAILNDSNQPDTVFLYQLKKLEKGSWTKARLSRLKNNKPSILAKLIQSQKITPIPKSSISFVSNAPIDLALNTGFDSTSLAHFNGDDLDTTLCEELKVKLAEELKLEKDTINLKNISFIKSPLSLDDLENHAIGVVANYLSKIKPDHCARADVLMTALYTEIKVKATCTEQANSFEELRNKRGITKYQFAGMLAEVIARKPVGDVLEDAINRLEYEAVPFNQRKSLREAASRLIVDRLNPSNALINNLETEVDNLLKTPPPSDLITNWEVVKWVHQELELLPNWYSFSTLDDSYLKALILYGISK